MAAKKCACYTKGRRGTGEGGIGIYTTASGVMHYAKYQEIQPDGTAKQRMKRGFPDHKAASDFLASVRTDVARGTYSAPTKTTVAEWAGAWESLMRANGAISDSTKSTYSRVLRLHVAPRIGARPMTAIRQSDVRRLYADLEASGLSAGTLRLIHAVVKQLFDAAVEDRLIPASPVTGARKVIKSKGKPELMVWTPQQLVAFLSDRRAHDDPLADLWAFLAGTGARRGEALGLLWGDVDLDAGTARISASIGPHGRGPTKTHTVRTIDLDKALVAILRARRELWGGRAPRLVRPGAPVFGDEEGEFLRPGSVSMRWGYVQTDTAKRIAFPRIGLHGLRHTHASILIGNGVPVTTVAARLGHARTSMTLDVYSHLLPSSGRDAADLFGKLLDEG